MRKTKATSWVHRFTALSMAVVLFSTSVTFVFAGKPSKTYGEIAVGGGDSTSRFVLLNGEKAFNGRTFVSGALIATEGDAASVRINNGSSIRLEPNSSIDLNFTDSSIGGRVISGKVDVFAAPGIEVNVLNNNGVAVPVSAGQQDADDDGYNILIPTLIFAGIVGVAAIYVLTNGDDGNGSPVR